MAGSRRPGAMNAGRSHHHHDTVRDYNLGAGCPIQAASFAAWVGNQ